MSPYLYATGEGETRCSCGFYLYGVSVKRRGFTASDTNALQFRFDVLHNIPARRASTVSLCGREAVQRAEQALTPITKQQPPKTNVVAVVGEQRLLNRATTPAAAKSPTRDQRSRRAPDPSHFANAAPARRARNESKFTSALRDAIRNEPCPIAASIAEQRKHTNSVNKVGLRERSVYQRRTDTSLLSVPIQSQTAR